MHKVKYTIGLLLIGSLWGCGQSGALQLTNDPDLDKRPKYLLWHPADSTVNDQKDSNTSFK